MAFLRQINRKEAPPALWLTLALMLQRSSTAGKKASKKIQEESVN